MNERIRDLGRKAGLYMNDQHPGGFPNEELAVAEGFAQLVAQECAEICLEMAAKCAGLPGADALAALGRDCARQIRQDFGVE